MLWFPGGSPLKPSPSSFETVGFIARGRGFYARGRGFYVWEERRGDALRAARDLSPLGVSPVPKPAGPPSRRRR